MLAVIYARFGCQSFLERAEDPLRDMATQLFEYQPSDPHDVDPVPVRNLYRTLVGPGKELVVKVGCFERAM